MLFLLAALIVIDGLLGSPLAAKNTATVAAWVHYRGLVVLALLLVGNLFCAACPFMLPRTLAKWLGQPTDRWPKPLRNKWLALAGLVGIVYVYELFDLWASPVVDGMADRGLFRGRLCAGSALHPRQLLPVCLPAGHVQLPLQHGQPLARSAHAARQVCRDCVGHECINGSETQQGCQLELYVPTLHSNLDCTFCLDCVKACPHDNVALASRAAGRGTLAPAWPHRLDLAMLAIVAAFVGLVNAFAMTPPVYALEARLAASAEHAERGDRARPRLWDRRGGNTACAGLCRGLAGSQH